MIYLMESKMPYGRTVGFKVGFTKEAQKRFYAYRTHNPWCDVIDIDENGTEELEKDFHEKMDELPHIFNQVGRTEWYEVIDRKIIKEIEKKGLRSIVELYDKEMERCVEIIASWRKSLDNSLIK